MVKISNGKQTYNYEGRAFDTIVLDKKIKEDFAEYCKSQKINKSRLVESFMKTILLRLRDNSLAKTNGYVTINVFSQDVKKLK